LALVVSHGFHGLAEPLVSSPYFSTTRTGDRAPPLAPQWRALATASLAIAWRPFFVRPVTAKTSWAVLPRRATIFQPPDTAVVTRRCIRSAATCPLVRAMRPGTRVLIRPAPPSASRPSTRPRPSNIAEWLRTTRATPPPTPADPIGPYDRGPPLPPLPLANQTGPVQWSTGRQQRTGPQQRQGMEPGSGPGRGSGPTGPGRGAATAPTVSFTALRRARRTLLDFVQSYFPLHPECSAEGPEGPWKKFWEEGIFEVLVFVESAVYGMDEENEALAGLGIQAVEYNLPGMTVVKEILQHRGLWDAEVEREFACGLGYWRAERRLCALMKQGRLAAACNHPKPDPREPADSAGAGKRRRTGGTAPCAQLLEDVHAASESKSFDYRVLHILLHKILRKPSCSTLLEVCRVDEILLDIHDDLVDYEGDVRDGTFNILRAYSHIFGPVRASAEIAGRISRLEAELDAKLALLPSGLRDAYMRRRSEALKEEPGGRCWEIPRTFSPFEEAGLREAERSSSVE